MYVEILDFSKEVRLYCINSRDALDNLFTVIAMSEQKEKVEILLLVILSTDHEIKILGSRFKKSRHENKINSFVRTAVGDTNNNFIYSTTYIWNKFVKI